MILRDHDANTAWASQADGTLESRTYICQNWRADVVALMTSAGELINQVRYDPYGVPFGIAKPPMRLALDADGDVDGDDYTRFSTLHSGGTHPYADWNWDGTVNTSDITAYLNDQSADTGLGRGDPAYAWSHAGGALRKAYAGYEIDPVLTGAEGWESVYHVRHRVYLSTLGRWTRRDPLGYVDGMSLYRYASGTPVIKGDPLGLSPACYDAKVDKCSALPFDLKVVEGQNNPQGIVCGGKHFREFASEKAFDFLKKLLDAIAFLDGECQLYCIWTNQGDKGKCEDWDEEWNVWVYRWYFGNVDGGYEVQIGPCKYWFSDVSNHCTIRDKLGKCKCLGLQA